MQFHFPRRARRRSGQLVYPAATLWPEPAACSPCTCCCPSHQQRWGDKALLRAAAGGGEGPEHEDPGGLGGRQGRPSQAAWARQLGWEQGSWAWLWASGLVSASVLCLQDQGQVVGRVFLECSCSRPQDMCPFSYHPHCR